MTKLKKVLDAEKISMYKLHQEINRDKRRKGLSLVSVQRIATGKVMWPRKESKEIILRAVNHLAENEYTLNQLFE